MYPLLPSRRLKIATFLFFELVLVYRFFECTSVVSKRNDIVLFNFSTILASSVFESFLLLSGFICVMLLLVSILEDEPYPSSDCSVEHGSVSFESLSRRLFLANSSFVSLKPCTTSPYSTFS